MLEQVLSESGSLELNTSGDHNGIQLKTWPLLWTLQTQWQYGTLRLHYRVSLHMCECNCDGSCINMSRWLVRARERVKVKMHQCIIPILVILLALLHYYGCHLSGSWSGTCSQCSLSSLPMLGCQAYVLCRHSQHLHLTCLDFINPLTAI